MADGRSVTGRIKAAHGKEHHRGFDAALEDALAQLSTEIGTGSYPVEVTFHADVEVSNPGAIGFYKVKLTPTGEST
jgi:hypothetical protein